MWGKRPLTPFPTGFWTGHETAAFDPLAKKNPCFLSQRITWEMRKPSHSQFKGMRCCMTLTWVQGCSHCCPMLLTPRGLITHMNSSLPIKLPQHQWLFIILIVLINRSSSLKNNISKFGNLWNSFKIIISHQLQFWYMNFLPSHSSSLCLLNCFPLMKMKPKPFHLIPKQNTMFFSSR